MTRRIGLVGAVLALVLVIVPVGASAASSFDPFGGGPGGGGAFGVPAQPFQEPACCSANGADFAKNGGDDGNQNFSSLDQINLRDVSQLSGAWQYHLEGGSTAQGQQDTPIESGGVLYTMSTQQDVFAFNAATGALKWEWKSGLTQTQSMRGLGLGGGSIYAPLADGSMVALNAATGTPEWRTQLLGATGYDPTALGGYLPGDVVYSTLGPSSAPNDGMIFTGTGGGDGSFRGRFFGLDAKTGAVVWRNWGTAAPGTPGGDTWPANSTAYLTGGGASWMGPALDPQTDTLYYTVGNPFPDTDGATRAGDNLFTDSLLAVNPQTGAMKWYYQLVHHDLWDVDSEMMPVLTDLMVRDDHHGRDGRGRPGEQMEKVVVFGSKSGKLAILNRVTGQPVVPIHDVTLPAQDQSAQQETSSTQPIPDGDSFVPTCPSNQNATRAIPNYDVGCQFDGNYWNYPTIVTPGTAGGADWAMYSFDRNTGLLYVPASLTDSGFTNGQPGNASRFFRPEGEDRSGLIAAIDPRDNRVVWSAHTTYPLSNGQGVLSTAGGLIFEGLPDGNLTARSAIDGRLVWTFQTGTPIATTPITYSVNGVQYVAILTGGDKLTFPDEQTGDDLFVLKLNGPLPPQAAPPAPSVRLPITQTEVPGAVANYTVTLGQTWNNTTSKPSGTENLSGMNSMAPDNMSVPVGTTVTFTNPTSNANAHCADEFFDNAFKTGLLQPGQSATVKFNTPGLYYYNDCNYPQNTGQIVVSASGDADGAGNNQ